jgi:hypothetical protein
MTIDYDRLKNKCDEQEKSLKLSKEENENLKTNMNKYKLDKDLSND